MKCLKKWTVILFVGGILISCKEERYTDTVIKGIKFYPEHSRFTNAETCARSIQNAGFNTVFMPVRDNDLSDTAEFDLYAFRYELQKCDIRFAAIVPVFYDPERWDAYPQWRALDQNLNDSPEFWQKMLSPACGEFRNQKIELINRIIRELHPDMLTLDFIRYPVFWENVHVDSLKNITRTYDYNSLFINKFMDLHKADSIPSTLPDNLTSQEWVSFKTDQITTFVKAVKKEIGDLTLILHILPWLEKDQDLFLKSIAGQDVDSLGKYADFLSPMMYTMVPGLSAERINNMVSEFASRHPNVKLAPSYQFTNDLSDLQTDSNYILFHWGLIEKLKENP